MARVKSISTLDTEIAKVNDELAKLKKKEEALLEELTKLQEKKQLAEAKQVMEAFRKSGKSLQGADDISRGLITSGNVLKWSLV